MEAPGGRLRAQGRPLRAPEGPTEAPKVTIERPKATIGSALEAHSGLQGGQGRLGWGPGGSIESSEAPMGGPLRHQRDPWRVHGRSSTAQGGIFNDPWDIFLSFLMLFIVYFSFHVFVIIKILRNRMGHASGARGRHSRAQVRPLRRGGERLRAPGRPCGAAGRHLIVGGR